MNFYRALPTRDAATTAREVALTFMGARPDGWPPARRAEMATFFSRIAYKKTDEWKEEIVYLDPTPSTPLKAVFPDGATTTIPAESDPRQVFADWLLRRGINGSRATSVNRIWAWTMGRGIIQRGGRHPAGQPPGEPGNAGVPGKRAGQRSL